MKPARVLVADPPWRPDDALGARGAEAHYDGTLSVEEICAFPLPPLEDDAVLFLWRISSMVEEAYRVVRAWGFVPKTELVWEKRTQAGKTLVVHRGRWLDDAGNVVDEIADETYDVPEGKPAFGLGRILRGAHETCIVATRGNPNRLVKAKNVRTSFLAEVRRHSEKPAKFYAIVESLFDGPYVELFARSEREGWECFGNEIARAHPGAAPRKETTMDQDAWARAIARLAIEEKARDAWAEAAAVLAALDAAPDAPPAKDESAPAPVELPRTRKRGRRSNIQIAGDIADGLRLFGLDVPLTKIAQWTTDEKKSAEAWLEARAEGKAGELPPFVARDRVSEERPHVLAPPPPPASESRHVRMPDVAAAPVDRDITHGEWIAYAIADGIVDADAIAAAGDEHQAYCLVLQRAPVRWFARTKLLILQRECAPAPAPPKPSQWDICIMAVTEPEPSFIDGRVV